MKLNQLKPAAGSRKSRKRVGRGHGSGLGKTAGMGHKGQKARSGGQTFAGFEGGQMPLHRRLPKFGFTNIFREEYEIVNLATLEKFGLEGDITPDSLAERGLVRKGRKVKVLGQGNLTKAVTVTADRFSKSAIAKIEQAGGKAVAR